MEYDDKYFELTSSEKNTLNNKIEIFFKCLDIFQNYITVNQSILRAFTSKEILSDDIDVLIKRVMNNRLISFYDIISYNDNIVEDFKDNLPNAALRVLFKCNKFKRENHSDIAATLSFLVKRVLSEECYEEFFYKLCSSGLLEIDNLKYSDTLETFVCKMLSSCSIKNPDMFMKEVDLNIPRFKSYPLIILNENIEKDTRIKILKNKYKQKDLASYINEIEKNVKSLDIVDDFIEATVLQNNRVKEKNAGIINIMKYLFIGNGSTYFRSNKYTNIYKFASKYKKYFLDPEFCKMFFEKCLNFQTMSYYRSRNFREFLSAVIMKGCNDDDEQLTILTNFSRFTDTFESMSDIIMIQLQQDNIDAVKKFIKKTLEIILTQCNTKGERGYVIYVYKMDAFRKIQDDDRFLNFLDEEFYNKIKLYDKVTNSPLSENILSRYYDIKSIDQLDLFLRRDVLNVDDIVSGGISIYNVFDVSENKVTAGFDMTDVVGSFKNYLENVFNYLSNENAKFSNESLRIFLNRYIRPFKDDDNLSMIADNIMQFDNTNFDYLKYDVRYSWNKKSRVKTSEIMIKNIENILKLAKLKYRQLIGVYDEFTEEEYNYIVNGLESAIDSVNLLLAL